MIICGELVKYEYGLEIIRLYISEILFINVYCFEDKRYRICLDENSETNKNYWYKINV